MKRKRKKETRKNRPARSVNFTIAVLYQDDLDYLKEHGIPMARALRVALKEYILDLKAKERRCPVLHTVEKVERDIWILAAKDDRTTRPVPVLDSAAVPAAAGSEIFHELAPIAPNLRGATKAEHAAWLVSEEKANLDSWILNGVLPTRVMMANRTAGTQIMDAPRV